MADGPENLVLHQLREIRAENARLHAETQAENERRHAEMRAEFREVREVVVATSKAVNTLHDGLRDLTRGQAIIETEMRALLRGRIERIEDRMDGVKA